MSQTIIGIVASVSMLAFAVACNQESLPTTPSVIVIRITPGAPTLQVGQSVQLSASATGVSTAEGFQWRSNNEKIATVSQLGVVTGVGAGQVTIVAKVASDTAAEGGIDITVR